MFLRNSLCFSQRTWPVRPATGSLQNSPLLYGIAQPLTKFHPPYGIPPPPLAEFGPVCHPLRYEISENPIFRNSPIMGPIPQGNPAHLSPNFPNPFRNAGPNSQILGRIPTLLSSEFSSWFWKHHNTSNDGHVPHVGKDIGARFVQQASQSTRCSV